MKRWNIAFLVLLLVFCLCGCHRDDRGSAFSGVGGNYIALVGDERLYEYEYRYFYSRALEDYQASEENLPADFVPDENLAKQLSSEALERARRFKIAWIAAVENGCVLSEDEKTAIAETVERHAVFCQETHPEWNVGKEEVIPLVYGGISYAQYGSIVLQQNLIQKYQLQKSSDFSLEEDVLRTYYSSHETEYKSVSLRALYFSALSDEGERISSEAWNRKQQRARELLQEVQSDEEMTAAVLAESEEGGAEESAGRYTIRLNGIGNLSVFLPFAAEAGRKAGDMTLVETADGMYVLRCIDVEDYDTSASIRSAVKNDLIAEYWDGYIHDLAKQEKYALTKVKYDELQLMF